ncbi:MAG: twin-arginine translocase TatA/TatE family subunit [Chloroflexi bacterium]|nr:twin-arginine translocase TatA/TatE family subunit [Chloroflexota bacterium]
MNFFGIGFFEIALILIIAFLVLGPAKMLDTAKTLGKSLRQLQRAATEIPRLLTVDEEPKPKKDTAPPRQQVADKPGEEQGDRPVPRA